MSKSKNFGEYLTRLANDKLPAASAATIDAMKAKLETERQARVEQQLRTVFNGIEMNVERIRALRRTEKQYKAEITRLEKKANDIVNGKEDDSSF